MSTPYAFATFLRASVIRVAAGAMLLGAVFSGLATMTTASADSRFSCAISCAVCLVAFYHYLALMSIRTQKALRVTLDAPGQAPEGLPSPLKLAWQDAAADAVRYSDWLVRAAYLHRTPPAFARFPLAHFAFPDRRLHSLQ